MNVGFRSQVTPRRNSTASRTQKQNPAFGDVVRYTAKTASLKPFESTVKGFADKLREKGNRVYVHLANIDGRGGVVSGIFTGDHADLAKSHIEVLGQMKGMQANRQLLFAKTTPSVELPAEMFD